MQPGRIDFPNLRVTISELDAGPWGDWAQDFLVKGNNDDSHEKSGAIVFLAHAVVTLLPTAFGAYRGEHDHGRHRDGNGGRIQRTEDALRSAGVEVGHPSLWGGARPEVAG